MEKKNSKRFIEESFPIKEVSQESSKEKYIIRGHISNLHTWWARRPLTSSRATSYAALIPAPKNERELDKKRQFIIDLSKWKNSLDPCIIEKARKDILKANGGKKPKVLDPFAGGGAIPLEVLRLGCETYAGEYNPVAVLILKATLEYPQKYGKLKKVKQGLVLFKEEMINPLLEDVKKWGNWILEKAKKETSKFYPEEKDGFILVGYIWAKTIPCQNPSCSAEIPLMRQFWFEKKNKNVALKPFINDRKVEFEIVGQNNDFPTDFDPSKGTVSRAVAKCLICGSMVDSSTTRKLFQEGKSGQRMIAAVLYHPKIKEKIYRLTNNRDCEIFKEAEKYLEEKREKLMEEWGIDPVPDEKIPLMSGTFNVPIYGITKWGDLFNSRQKLALITFVEKVREAYKEMLKDKYEEEYAKAIVSYLALTLDKIASYCSSNCTWHVNRTQVTNTFVGRQAIQMTWDYFELNPMSEISIGWKRAISIVVNGLKITNNIPNNFRKVFQSSATSLHYPINYFDAIFTDPPYYNSVPYADLSDFFYVWLKRTIGDLYPELFSTPLTPKTKEIVEMAGWDPVRYAYKDKKFFEENLKKSFQEIYRVLKPNGIATIVYAHKSTAGWGNIDKLTFRF